MSGLNLYLNAPPASGGIEISKGNNTRPIIIRIEPGGTSSDVTIYAGTPLADFYFQSVVVDPVDIVGPDESGWLRLAPADINGDPDTYGAPGASLALSPSTVGPGLNIYTKFFVKATVPGTATAEIKIDVKLQHTATKRPVVT